MLSQYDAIINKYAAQYGVPVAWIKAIIMTESSGNPRAYRAEPKINDASYGLMQLLSSTAKDLGFNGTTDQLYDEDTNIQLGTKYISNWRKSLGDDFEAVYSAYNSGSPTKYLTSTQVAKHVSNAVTWLNKVITEEPFIASSGAGLLLLSILIWLWKIRK